MEMEPWGKVDAAGSKHHLAHHSADVAAVLERLLTLPALRASAEAATGGLLDPADVARIVGWAYLHDVGKLAPGFQAKGWADGLWRGATESHLDAGHVWFKWNGGRFASLGLGGWYPALFAHHGRPVSQPPGRAAKWPVLLHYDWRAGEAQLLDGLSRWFPAPEGRLPVAPRLHHLFAGLLALADWIGSDRRWFGFVERYDSRYGSQARERAATALAAIGLDGGGWRPMVAPGFAALTGYDTPNPTQAAVAEVPGEERLVILEAETGSGKTEAALWRFARLLAEGRVEGMYLALPTRAAAGQVQWRVSQALRRWLGEGSPGALLAVPGLLRVDDHEGYRLPGWEVRWDDGGRRWAAEHANRFLAAPVAVGTVDQAMMAALSVKHAPMRAAALARSLLVLDEVHASDTYMRRVLHQLLEDHLALNGHAMLMSATLGSVARAAWLGVPRPSLAEAAAAPYPMVWTRAGAAPAAGAGAEKRVALEACATMAPEEAARRAVAAARQGARVLVLRNTVSAAVATWHAACAAAPGLAMQVAGGPALHHARFAAEDRALLDAAVEAALGKGRGDGPVVVVGTQTLEQALDIDADLLLCDLCPMDVLLQRIGRLHRHARPRPGGFAEARAVVLMPEAGLAALVDPPRFENGLGGWEEAGTVQGIYIDLCGLEATRRLVVQVPEWRIPAMNRRLVEEATHPEALAAIRDEMGWQDYDIRIVAKEAAAAMQGRYVTYGKGMAFAEGFRPLEDDAPVRTRLGADGAVIDLPPGTIGPFGGEVRRIALPAHWSVGLTGTETVAVEGNCFRIGDRLFRYDRAGLQRDAG